MAEEGLARRKGPRGSCINCIGTAKRRVEARATELQWRKNTAAETSSAATAATAAAGRQSKNRRAAQISLVLRREAAISPRDNKNYRLSAAENNGAEERESLRSWLAFIKARHASGSDLRRRAPLPLAYPRPTRPGQLLASS